MKAKKFYLVSLGCAKNTVDSESMASLLQQSGYAPALKPGEASVLIVNTCGFISPARQESLETLNELAAGKKPGQVLIAAGCLTERDRALLTGSVAGLDGVIGTRDWVNIVQVVQAAREKQPFPQANYNLPEQPAVEAPGVARVARQGTSAYLKIADGCRRPCAFCSIPLIKGKLASRAPEAIWTEVEGLAKLGLQELILIAQDTTDYGHDLGLQNGLAHLLDGITQRAPEIPWVRILYSYPGYVTDELIELMASRPQLLHYLDMPLQHAHPETLKRMRRPANVEWVYKTIEKMRAAMPDLSLRTTFIAGYPGETEEEFQTLLDFIREIRFDHLGVFPFSFEPGTASEPLGDPIAPALKEERIQRIMLEQEKISLSRNQTHVGKLQDVLVEGYSDGISVGRAYHDAPEIDGMVFVEGKLPVGVISPVQITGAMTHDLTARVLPKKR